MSLPQSTSYVVTMPMYLSSDHVTEAGSALSPTVTISKNGAAFANPNAGASTATSVGNNIYKFTLATQDSNTLGDLWVRFTEATCDPGQRLLVVVKATNGGLTAIPDTAVTTNASLLTSGTGTDQIQSSAGIVSSDMKKILGTASAGAVGYVGIDWAAISGKTTANALTGTTIATTQKVDVETIKTNPVVNAGTVTFPTGATIASTTNITSATGIVPATGAITNAQAATIPSSGTITTGTNQTGDAYSYLTTNLGALGANLSGVPKTGFKLASDGLASVTAWTVSITGNITGNLSGSVGSVTSAIVLPTAPTDWITSASVSAAAVSKIQSGLSTYAGGDTSGTTTLLTRIAGVIPTNPLLTTDARLNNLDATITSRLAAASYATPPSSSDNANAVWQSLTTTNWGANTFGNFVLISNNSNRSVFVTSAGAGHVACDVYAMQPDVLTASAMATDAVTEIWAASSRTLTAFGFNPTVGGYATGQDPATLLLVNGSANKLKVNTDNSVNATATIDVSAVATAVANILFVDGATNQLKVNADNTVNATVSGTIVNYVTIPSAVAQASIIPLRITMIRGDTLSVQLPAMGTLTGRTKLIFTAKATTNTPDAAALFQITEAGGLVTLLGSSSVTGTGSLVVANATTGLVNLTLSATATALIPATTTPYVWDCEVIGPSGTRTPISGTLLALPDVTLQAT